MNNTRILLVGLGNTTLPNTRHNVGMMALDSIAKALNLNWTQKATWKSDVTETTLRIPSADTVKEYQVTFLKPRKLMNISGSCVAQAVKDLSIPLKNLYVFHDDMQRDIGKVNLKGNGSANGHNGIKSVIDNLRTNEFKRVRIGVGRPAAEIDDRSYGVVANFVLGKFTTKELDMLEKTVYPMWTQNQGLELLCDKGELIQSPKKKNKHSNPNKIKKKKKEELFEEHEQLVAQEPHNINIEDK